MLQLARNTDRDAVEAIAKQVHEMHVAWRPDIYEMPDALYSQARFAAAVAERQLYVAKTDDSIVGYVLLKIRNYDWPGVIRRRVMIIDEFGVREEYRNQGIGTGVMEDVKALARAFGCTDIELGVYPQNDDAVRFYQKCGLTIRSIEMQMKV